MAELAHPVLTLLIEQTDSTFILSDQGRTIQTLALVRKATLPGDSARPAPPDSARWATAPAASRTDTAGTGSGPPPAEAGPPRGASSQPPPEGAPYQAWWDRSRLMAARVTARGGRMSEIFELSNHGKSLVIRTSVELRPDTPPIEVRRVYQRYEGE